jgi:hypothetical protein
MLRRDFISTSAAAAVLTAVPVLAVAKPAEFYAAEWVEKEDDISEVAQIRWVFERTECVEFVLVITAVK